jgi:hypothetical protein
MRLHSSIHRLAWSVLLVAPAAWLHAELGLVAHYPVHGSTNICPDTPLQLNFSEPVVPGRTGQLRVVRVRDGRVVDTLNIGDNNPTNRCGTQVLRYEPFRIDGNMVTVQLHAHVLDSETYTAYAVVIEPGLFESAAGDVFGGMTNGGWQHGTRSRLVEPGWKLRRKAGATFARCRARWITFQNGIRHLARYSSEMAPMIR